MHSMCPLFGYGIAGSPSNTKSPELMPGSIPSGILIHASIWPQQIWAENWVMVVPLWGRGSWIPIYHNVARAEAYLQAKFHLDPSNRLATVHERYRQADRTDRQWTDSIGRTVLQTVAQKWSNLHFSVFFAMQGEPFPRITPLVNRSVDDVLFKVASSLRQAFLEVVDVINLCFIMHCCITLQISKFKAHDDPGSV